MSALEMYLEQVRHGRGMQHLTALHSLRDYMKATKEEDLITAIGKLTDVRHLRTLVEAGLKPRLMQAVLSRQTELEKRQEGM